MLPKISKVIKLNPVMPDSTTHAHPSSQANINLLSAFRQRIFVHETMALPILEISFKGIYTIYNFL